MENSRLKLVGRGPRALFAAVLVLGLALVANALFLVLCRVLDLVPGLATRPDDLPLPYQLLLLGHTALGVIVAPLALVFAAWHLASVWKRRHRGALVSGIAVSLGVAGLLGTGLFILTEAATRENRWAWWAHVALAAALPAAWLAHRFVSASRPEPRSVGRALGATAAVAVALVALHAATAKREAQRPPSTVMPTVMTDAEIGAPGDPFLPFRGVADVPRESRFHPSAATTSTGELMPSRVVTRDELPDPQALRKEIEERGFVVDHRIGAETCARCHADVVEQWASSAHRFSSMNNPFYKKPFMDLRARADKGKHPSQWCSGCHEPALMQAGRVLTDFDPASAEAQAGLTCLSCHAIDALHARTGNGAYNLPAESRSPYLFFDASGGLRREIGDLLIKARPSAHRSDMLKATHRTSEFCSACHKVNLDVPVNGWRWFRGQNEYDAWHDSGVARNAARTFYLPPNVRRCQDCHMPLEKAVLGDVAAKAGMVRSHRFLAVNTALPALRGDHDTIRRTEEFLKDGKLRVDLFALRRLAPDGTERAVVRPLNLARPSLAPGETVEVQVVVRNLGVGHTFPGGTNDSNEGWLAFEAELPDGTVLRSGWLQDDRSLEPGAHVYTVVMAAHDGRVAAFRNPQDFHGPILARVIGPGSADLARFNLKVPESAAGGVVRLRAELKWRKFKQVYTEYVFAGETAPELPVTVIASDEIELPVAASADEVEVPADVPAEAWMRFNDWGIGLLVQGDTRGATRAFGDLVRLFPARVDGWRNRARTAWTDGNLAAAYEDLRRAEELAPSDPQTAWVWGNVLHDDGRYADAKDAWQRVLQAFPSDRDTWRRLGRTLYLDQAPQESLEAWLAALRIDPEDAVAHYHRALCYRALGREADAAEAEAAYRKYQVDEGAQAVTQQARLEDPDLQRESNPVHAHELVPATDSSVLGQ